MHNVKQKTGLYWLLLSIFVIILDQISKQLVLQHLQMHEPLYLLPMLNFTLSYNPGAAFNFLGDASGWQRWLFTGVALAVSVGIIAWLRNLNMATRINLWTGVGLSLILGGAVGNLIDRIIYGYVIDFIDFHVNTWHFATFNVADTAVNIGVFILILTYVLGSKK